MTNWLMLVRDIIGNYSENHVKHIDTLCGQNSAFLMLKEVVHYSNHCALKCSGDFHNPFKCHILPTSGLEL
jgi:hypothetical protein